MAAQERAWAAEALAAATLLRLGQYDGNMCDARVWKWKEKPESGGLGYKSGYDNIQCSKKKVNGCLCKKHFKMQEAGTLWLGLITEPRPEEPTKPDGTKMFWSTDADGNEVVNQKKARPAVAGVIPDDHRVTVTRAADLKEYHRQKAYIHSHPKCTSVPPRAAAVIPDDHRVTVTRAADPKEYHRQKGYIHANPGCPSVPPRKFERGSNRASPDQSSDEEIKQLEELLEKKKKEREGKEEDHRQSGVEPEPEPELS